MQLDLTNEKNIYSDFVSRLTEFESSHELHENLRKMNEKALEEIIDFFKAEASDSDNLHLTIRES